MALVETTLIRLLANFPPSIWGTRSICSSHGRTKEEVRSLITDLTVNSNVKLNLIYSVNHLGLSYLFVEEIDAQLEKLFKDLSLKDYEETDLHTISMYCQAFRHHRYKFSCDVFTKFKDGGAGTFKECITSDARGILGLYDCSHIRIRGEDILDEALAFTRTQFKKIVITLEGNLARQVNQALKRPFHQGIPVVVARPYLCAYEEESSRNELLLKLAKVHFNYLQLLHKEELRVVTK